MTFDSGGLGDPESGSTLEGSDSPPGGELRAIAHEVVLAVAAGSLPGELQDRLAGAALLAGIEAEEVVGILRNGPHTVAAGLRVAGRLLLVAHRRSADIGAWLKPLGRRSTV